MKRGNSFKWQNQGTEVAWLRSRYLDPCCYSALHGLLWLLLLTLQS